MASFLRKIVSSALVALGATAPVGASDRSSDNVLEARLGGERLILRSKPAAATTMSTINPAGIALINSQLLHSGALSGVANGCKGALVAAMSGSFTNGAVGFPQALNAQLFSNATIVSSESEPGLNFVIDNQSGLNGSGRFNLNDSTTGAGHQMLATVGYVSQSSPFPNDVPFVLEWSWNTCGTTWYEAAYVNGVQILSNTGSAAAPLSIDYANAAGFLIGQVGPNSALANTGGFNLYELYIDFANSYVTNPTTPTILLSDRQKFYNNGLVPINGASGNCSLPYGTQPAICFTSENSNLQTNLGSGGSFTASGSGITAASYPFAGPDSGVTAQRWQSMGGASTTSVTASTDQHVMELNDLLLMTVIAQNSTISTTISCPTVGTWTQIYSTFNPDGDNGVAPNPTTMVTCYHVVTASDITGRSGSTPVTWSATLSTALNSEWSLIDISGADPVNPIDVYTSQVDLTVATSHGLPQVATSYNGDLVVEVAGYQQELGTIPTGASGLAIRDATALKSASPSSTVPALLAWDATVAAASSPSSTAFGAITLSSSKSLLSAAIAIKPASASLAAAAHGTFTSGTLGGVGTFRLPASVPSSLAALCYGSGAGGGGSSSTHPSGGSGGGEATSTITTGLSAGQLVYYSVGVPGLGASASGAAGNPSWINVASNAVPTGTTQGCEASGGAATTSIAAGTPGAAVIGTGYSGGLGATGAATPGGGGGSGAGSASNGAAGSIPTGGASVGGGSGAGGTASTSAPNPGSAFGGGGAGRWSGGWGGNGGAGGVAVTF